MADGNFGPLVSTEWLAGELGKPDLVVFDCTFYLPTEKRDAPAEFRDAHIPGARFFDIEEIADPESDLPHMLPTAARFQKLVRALGVSASSRVVFYDQKGIFSVARGWWMLRLFGHDAVAVLDGGLPKWRAEGRPVESGEPAPAQPGDLVADFRATRLRGIGDMKAIVADGSALVLDARGKGRFDGTAPEPRPGLPAGHMPGAASVPFTDLLAPDQTLLPPAALRARFAAAGVDGTRPVVTSCGTGVSACVLTLGLARAGLPEGAVYDGSWTEWAGRPETPKVTS
ncbi:rhodanese-like domain-containing protein [Roseomonas sp. NAR14]|uniref:3-mercaptopyruvate sulfurtransferase n=1 Tax=Roseomonas acroporae TaxID=2937791 RepID=A0A9X2BU87_9PROT|nr:rhodanese-like domain-containing protein [Roseomonas acroporae]MCK8785247.1 rhodanese-like domain-containing protein [Roseomonas acroporae]